MTSNIKPLPRPDVGVSPGSSGTNPALPPIPSARKKPRLIGVDVTRGLALLGMMAVHALIPFDENFQPNWVTYVATGNASAVFAVLAGVGLALTTGRAAVPRSKALSTAASVAGRAAAVGVIGLLLGYTDAEIAGVILPYYAMLFLLAIPLLFLGTRLLVLVGILAAVAVPALSEFFRPALPEPTLLNHSFFYLFDHPLDLLSELLVTGAYPALPWMSYICAGLVVGRLTLSSVKVARRLLVFGVGLGVAATTVSWYLLGPLGGRAALRLAAPGPLNRDGDTVDDLLVFGFDGTTPTGSWWWLATSAPHSATPLDLLRTIGIAVAVLGAMLLIDHLPASRLRQGVHALVAPVAAAGSMTLTLYAATVVFLNSPLDQFSPVGGYVFQVVTVLLFALGWRQAVGRGPLETAVTAVANGARDWAVRATSREHHPSGADAAAATTPEQEAISWWENEAEASPAGSSSDPRPSRRRRRRTGSAERGWSTSTASDEDVWSWWEGEAAVSPAESSEAGPSRWGRARPAQRRWSTSTASDEDVWSWWEDEVEAQPADSSPASERDPNSSTSSRGI